MDIEVHHTIQCCCGRFFDNHGAWKTHRHSCKAGKKRLSDALDRARSTFSAKRRKIDKSKPTGPPILQSSAGPSCQSNAPSPAVQADVASTGIKPATVTPVIHSTGTGSNFEPAIIIPPVGVENVPSIAEVSYRLSRQHYNPLMRSSGTSPVRTYNTTKEAQPTAPYAF